MLAQEFLVDGFPPAEAFLLAMPEPDRVFAEFPAEADVLASVVSHEVQQPYIEVFHQRAALLDLLHGVLERRSAGIATGSKTDELVRIHARSARHPHFIGVALQLLTSLLIL